MILITMNVNVNWRLIYTTIIMPSSRSTALTK